MAENDAPERIWIALYDAEWRTTQFHDGDGIEYIRADLAAPDAAQWSKKFPTIDGWYWVRFMGYGEPGEPEMHRVVGNECYTETSTFTGRPGQTCDKWEFLGPLQPITPDAVRQARQETWNSVISKLNERAEDWRLQAERWQKQAENEANEEIRNLSFSDRDACLSKMAALKTFAIEAAALCAEGKGDDDA